MPPKIKVIVSEDKDASPMEYSQVVGLINQFRNDTIDLTPKNDAREYKPLQLESNKKVTTTEVVDIIGTINKL